MKNKSPKGMLMRCLNTPFGNICIKLDGKEIDFLLNPIDKDDVLYPDIDGAYRIIVTMEQDWKKHDLKIELQDSGTVGEAETGERLEALSFYKGEGKITLGVKASFGDYQDYGYDYDGALCSDGIEIYVFPYTRPKMYEFGVCWILKCTAETDVQTWYGADLSI